MTLFFNHKYSFIKNKKKLKKKKHTSSGELTSNPSSFPRSLTISKCPCLHAILNPVNWEKKQENRKKKQRKKKEWKNKRNKTKKKESEFQHNPSPNKNKKPQKDENIYTPWFWHWYQRLVLRDIAPLQEVPKGKPSERVSIHAKYISKHFTLGEKRKKKK